MRVVILHNEPGPPDQAEELRIGEANAAVYDAVRCASDACRENGWEPVISPVGNPGLMIEAVRGADVVVNFVEAIGDDARLEPAAAWLLEWIGVPFTGSGGSALSLGLDKHRAKACIAAAGVAVARGCVLAQHDEPIPDGLRYPLIVKPSREDASLGIDEASVVGDEASMRARAARVIDRFRQPVIVEEFIDGREMAAAIITRGAGNEPPEFLPIEEYDYSTMPAGMPHILGYDAKWDKDSDAFRMTPPFYPSDLTQPEREGIEGAALAVWKAIGLRDYARVDIRLQPDGTPVVIEVNPNPDLSLEGGLAGMAAHAGISYPDLFRRIVEAALARGASPA